MAPGSRNASDLREDFRTELLDVLGRRFSSQLQASRLESDVCSQLSDTSSCRGTRTHLRSGPHRAINAPWVTTADSECHILAAGLRWRVFLPLSPVTTGRGAAPVNRFDAQDSRTLRRTAGKTSRRPRVDRTVNEARTKRQVWNSSPGCYTWRVYAILELRLTYLPPHQARTRAATKADHVIGPPQPPHAGA